MKTRLDTLPVHLSYGTTLKTVMPGLIIGMMFLLAACGACFTNENVQLLLQLKPSAVDGADVAAENATLLRPVRGGVTDKGGITDDRAIMTIQSPSSAVNSGLRMLQSSSLLVPVERVVLEISRDEHSTGTAAIADNQKGLVQLLTRRMVTLDLRLTIRVASKNLPQAGRFLDELSSTFNVSQERVGLSADETVPADVMCLDVVRTAHLISTEDMSQ